jgi:5-methylcytosine-specific restriction endonuclease McrA
MPMNRANYPKDWNQISLRIRERDHWRCKFCGAENRKPHPKTGSIVVLTVAHLDHDTQNNSDENLAALCQKCHLTYDGQHHAKNARKTRIKKKEQAKLEAGQEKLL